ncbi:UNVERIFIED_CONTAM: hypothetical protein GTU68_007020 [Idotea baltica]|nr:hypothetical protein [Idotea baltica]
MSINNENMDPEKETLSEDDLEANQNLEEVEDDYEQEIQGLKDKYLRLFAEFDNYKKRTARERLDLIRTASEDLMLKLLPVLDDFDRAKKNAESNDSVENFSEGVSLVYQKLYQILESKGLKAMDAEVVDFDPELHEGITRIPVQDPALKGKIIDFIEKGYYLNDKIIRHAKVVIGE